jgi:hypothetical protein
MIGLTWRRNGLSWPSSGRRSFRNWSVAGSPALEAVTSGPRLRNKCTRSGEICSSSISVGEISCAAGRSSLMSGLVK